MRHVVPDTENGTRNLDLDGNEPCGYSLDG